MQTTAINGHPNKARKSQRVTCFHRLVRSCAITIIGYLFWGASRFLGTFSGYSRILGYPFFWYNLISSGIIQISGY